MPQFSAIRCCIAAMTSSRHSVRRVNDGSAKCLCLRLSGRGMTSRRDGELPEVVVQLDGDLVPADLGEVVLAQVLEDQVVEVGLGLAGDDELLAAQLLVDVLLGFLDGLDLVLAQRLEDGRVVLFGVSGEDLDAQHLLVEHALDRLVRDLLAGLEQDLARGLVDDVLARDAVQQALHRLGPTSTVSNG